MGSRIVDKKWMKVLLHVLAWMIVVSLPYLLFYNPEHKNISSPNGTSFFLLNILTNLLWVALFYLNSSLYVPLLLYKKKYAAYIFMLMVSFFVVLLFHKWFLTSLIQQLEFKWRSSIGFNLPACLFSVAASISYRLLSDQSKAQQLNLEKQRENLKTELLFLRSQISPHFMFNILNNMLALARMKSDQLEPTIFKLSSLMRYMLYEADQEVVPIRKEYDYLVSYIDLQRQRLGKKDILTVDFNYPEENYLIAPMLLVPFIENAFKHGAVISGKPFIHISLTCEKDVLKLTVKNSNPLEEGVEKDTAKGIGLANVHRRLNLLYKDAHHLEIKKEKEYFSVILEINLTKYAPLYSSR